jgi:ComF family protein
MQAQHGALCPTCWSGLNLIERPYCEVLGTPFPYDYGGGALSPEAIANPPAFGRLRSACLFEGPARELVHALKYGDRTELAPMMARWMQRAGADILADCDGLVPVPLHRMRRLSRRYNQAAELSRALSALTAIPALDTVLYRSRSTERQVGLRKTARQQNLKGAFSVPEHALPNVVGRRLVLVDDVYTTGATATAATKVLLRAGAANVSVLTFAMVAPGII